MGDARDTAKKKKAMEKKGAKSKPGVKVATPAPKTSAQPTKR
jgi:hypothetical protein